MPVWEEVIIFVIPGGILGGVLGSVESINARALMHQHNVRFSRERCLCILAAIVVGCLGGIGGAMASLFIMVLDGKIPDKMTDTLRLTLLCVGTVGGFLGLQLLRLVAERFSRTMEVAQKQAKTTAEQVATEVASAQADKTVKPIAEFSATMSLAAVALNEKEDAPGNALREQAINRIRELLATLPSDRYIAIITGRLLRQLQRYEEAVSVLTSVLKARDDQKLPHGHDYADILYNIACYKNLWARILSGNDQIAKAKSAWNDLTMSVHLSPNNLREAREDEDLKDLPSRISKSFEDLD